MRSCGAISGASAIKGVVDFASCMSASAQVIALGEILSPHRQLVILHDLLIIVFLQQKGLAPIPFQKSGTI